MFTFSLLITIAVASVQPEDPTLIVDPANSTAEQIAPSAAALLSKARQMKLQGDGSFGEIYRRAAWAAAEEQADNPATALDILDELLASPGSIFDVFDAHRIAGQLYSSKAQWADSLARYENAASLASQDPSLVDAHPLLYVSIMQGAAAAAAQDLSFDAAASYAMELRDHPSDGIPHRVVELPLFLPLGIFIMPVPPKLARVHGSRSSYLLQISSKVGRAFIQNLNALGRWQH